MRRPSISVLCPTAHRGPLVAASLGLLREAVDEVVVAADVRVELSDLAYYADVADVLLRYEHAGPNRHWPWLAAQARGDWLLLLDGDELPSAALVAALPELVADRRVRQYSLPIEWPWPAPDVRLAEEPWSSDRRLRLLRNDPGLAFAARKHGLAQEDPPIRFSDELPVYHLDLLLPDLARRQAKVARYDTELFGLLTPEGEPFNRAFYLPEEGDGQRATAPLPAEDAENVARALDLRGDPSRSFDAASVPLHDREAVAWYAPRTVLPAEAYQGAIELAEPLPRFTARRPDHRVWVEVENRGTARWPGGDGPDPRIRLGLGWQPVGGGERYDAGRALLPHSLDPGQRTLLPISVCGPPQSGPAELVLDLVHENVRWFGCTLTAPVEVEPSVDERIATLVESHGPLIPLEAAIAERRAVGAPDGLLRQGPSGAEPSDPEIAELIASLPLGGWAADAETIDRLIELVRVERPKAIVEFGSGTSTVVFAWLLAKSQKDGVRIVSFEQDPAWAERTRAALVERGLERTAAVVQVPVGARPGQPPGYVMSEEADGLLRRLEPGLILVDGPPVSSGASRVGTLDLVAPYLRGDATVVLDDALRDAELCVAEAWTLRDDFVLHGIRPTPKGLLEATLRAPNRRRRRLSSFLRKPLRRGSRPGSSQ